MGDEALDQDPLVSGGAQGEDLALLGLDLGLEAFDVGLVGWGGELDLGEAGECVSASLLDEGLGQGSPF